MPVTDIRVVTPNGYGALQEYSVDLWLGFSVPSTVYAVPNRGGPRSSRPIRKGTKVHAQAVQAARDAFQAAEKAAFLLRAETMMKAKP